MAKILIKNAEIITAKDTDKYYIGILDDTIQVISKEVPQGYEDMKTRRLLMPKVKLPCRAW